MRRAYLRNADTLIFTYLRFTANEYFPPEILGKMLNCGGRESEKRRERGERKKECENSLFFGSFSYYDGELHMNGTLMNELEVIDRNVRHIITLYILVLIISE